MKEACAVKGIKYGKVLKIRKCFEVCIYIYIYMTYYMIQSGIWRVISHEYFHEPKESANTASE